MRSRPHAATVSRWSASSGPGSITAISSMPTRYVLVPGPVITPGLGARTRRTRRLRAQAAPGVSSATLIVAPRSTGGGRRQYVDDGRLSVEPLQAALGRRHQVDVALAVTGQDIGRPHPF